MLESDDRPIPVGAQRAGGEQQVLQVLDGSGPGYQVPAARTLRTGSGAPVSAVGLITSAGQGLGLPVAVGGGAP